MKGLLYVKVERVSERLKISCKVHFVALLEISRRYCLDEKKNE